MLKQTFYFFYSLTQKHMITLRSVSMILCKYLAMYILNLLYSWQKAKFYSNNFRPFSKNKKWHSLLIYKSFVICSWRINHSKTWRRCVNLFMPRIWLTVCGLAPCCVRYTTRLSTTGGTRPATWCWCLTSRTPSSTRMFPLRYGATSYATPKIKMSNGIFLCPQDEIFSAIWTDAKLFKEKSFWCLTFFLLSVI